MVLRCISAVPAPIVAPRECKYPVVQRPLSTVPLPPVTRPACPRSSTPTWWNSCSSKLWYSRAIDAEGPGEPSASSAAVERTALKPRIRT
jgi:hypothetical protein